MMTMLAIDMKRTLRDPGIIFVIGVPVLMYLIFGAAQEYGQEPRLSKSASLTRSEQSRTQSDMQCHAWTVQTE